MNNSNLLVDAIKSGLGEMAEKNALAIKVAQDIVEREFKLGQKIAGLMFGDEPQTFAEKIAYYHAQQTLQENIIECERDAARSRIYLEKHA